MKKIISIILFIFLYTTAAWAQTLTASWYSVSSLQKEGTWKRSKGVMANGQMYDEKRNTCATRLFPLGTLLEVTAGGRSVRVRVTDRIGKRFANTRIDLSKAAFSKIANLERGLIQVQVKVVEE